MEEGRRFKVIKVEKTLGTDKQKLVSGIACTGMAAIGTYVYKNMLDPLSIQQLSLAFLSGMCTWYGFKDTMDSIKSKVKYNAKEVEMNEEELKKYLESIGVNEDITIYEEVSFDNEKGRGAK